MPSKPRPGKRGIYFEAPEVLAQALAERAAAERRPQTTVLVMALEEYLGVKPAAKPAPQKTTKAKGRRG